MNNEITTLKSEVAAMSMENNKLQQKALSRDIVVFGLPSIKKTKMNQLVTSLAAALAMQLNINDFVHIYPVQQKDKSKCTVYGELYSQQQKDFLIKECREKKPLLIEDVMTLKADDPKRGTEIFIRSKLTQKNRSILNEARNHKDDIKFAWENGGRILIRQTENSPIFEITSMAQLMEILTPTPNVNMETDDDENGDD